MKDRQERRPKAKGASQDGLALFPKKTQIRNARQPLDPCGQNLVPDSEGCSQDPACCEKAEQTKTTAQGQTLT